MRALMRDEVDQVSGGVALPLVVGAYAGGLGYAGGATMAGCWSGSGLGIAVATGAAVGLATAATPVMAAVVAGSAVIAGASYAVGNAPAIKGAMIGLAGGFGGGMGTPGVSGPSPQSQSCMGKGGGSW